MQMSFSVERRPKRAEAGLEAAEPATPTAVEASRAGARRTCATAATRILSTICAAKSFNPFASPTRGFATKSTAPSSNAFIVTSAPRSVSVEIMTTGIGRNRIRRPRKSIPSMRGISTSNVITSGLSSRIISRATNGSLAVPIHSISRCRLMISASRLRTSAESSTTTTRIFLLINSSLPQNRSTDPPAVVLATVAALPRASCATSVSGCAWASRFTIAFPVTGKNTTLRG